MSETETPKKRNCKIFLYVPHAFVERAIEIGWENPSSLAPAPKSCAILMEWKHDSEPKMPFRSRSREVRGER